MTVLDTWRIAKSKGLCSACSIELRENRAFFSCLVEEGPDLARRDFCTACWEQRGSEGAFCFWRSHRAPAPQKQTVDTELLLEFFERLQGAEDEHKKAFRFVLALYLMRRRELKLLGTGQCPGGENLLFERRSTGEKTEVANPGLDEQQIQQTAARLSELLSAGL